MFLTGSWMDFAIWKLLGLHSSLQGTARTAAGVMAPTANTCGSGGLAFSVNF